MASNASPRSPLKRALITSLKIGLYGLVIGVVAVVVAVAVAMSQLPDFKDLQSRNNLGQTVRVYGADGSLLVSMGPIYGDWLPYDQIPEVMKDAIISVEDKRFRHHPGVDPIGIIRALGVRAQKGKWRQGASTITQQLARNIFLTNRRTFGRKAKEGILALALERRFTKDQILELYLNREYFGGGAYGIDAASKRFFGHSARTLSLSEAAIIAGLVKAPSNYSPTADVDAAKDRAAVVIQVMRENGTITPEQAAEAQPAEVKIVTVQKQNSMRYFTDWVLPQLDTLIDVQGQPIDVWTTLDPNMQKLADQVINANAPDGAQGALVAIDRDGAVRAMIGGKDYVSSIYNRATEAQRQPGSSFKLFVYLAALEAGHKPDDMVQTSFSLNGWSPRNEGHVLPDTISLRQAFAESINTVSARLGQEVGYGTVADMAQRLGITSKIGNNPAITLGSSEVRLVDMTRAYAVIANKGVAVVPYGIKRVTTAKGDLLYQQQAADSRVLVSPWVAAEMTDLMQTAVLSGTGRAAQIGRPVAGKTGTTTSNKDGWFLGFSSGLTTGIWMGRDDSKAVGGLQGGRAPARAFHDFMIKAVANRPVENFDVQVKAPDWQEEPDNEAWFGGPDNGQAPQQGQFVDENGNPLPPDQQPQPQGPLADQPEQSRPAPRGPAPPPRADEMDGNGPPPNQRLDQQWLDRAIGRDRPRRPRPPPPPTSDTGDSVERRPMAPQP
ncbi:MAG TPA: PBP1A family penicillin-binding protein [Allosphingosinicella sp.]|jgi:penicillin-binding protein 1A|nr:PBP1A family penicillin-binding protein [Allosphingosinicella sp.]